MSTKFWLSPFIGIALSHATLIHTELIQWDSTKASPGYTLFGAKGKSYLIDMQGRLVHQWNGSGTNPKLLSYNGNLLDVTNQGKTFVEFDWDGNKVWEYTESRSSYAPHHDFIRIYNAKLGAYTTLYIANKSLSASEVAALGADPTQGPYDGSQIDAITEVDASGNIIWEWSFADHLIQDVDASKSNYVGTGKTIADYPNKLNANLPGRPIRKDWLHCNSLDYNAKLGQIVINSVQGEFYVIDHDNTFVKGDLSASKALAAGSAGDFLYRFGDPARYAQGDPPSLLTDWTKSTSGHKQIGGAHDIHWIEEGLSGAGNFMVFNNGEYLYEMTPQSSILEINPFKDKSGATGTNYVNPPSAGYYVLEGADPDQMKAKRNISNQVVWMYSSKSSVNFFSTIGSSASRLANGNTLITAMTTGQIFEVTPSGELAWEYIVPVTEDGIKTSFDDQYPNYNAIFRSYRYPFTHKAFEGKTLTPGSTLTQSAGSTAVNDKYFVNAQIQGHALYLNSPQNQWQNLQLSNSKGQVLWNQNLVQLPLQKDLSTLVPGTYYLSARQGSTFIRIPLSKR